MHCQKHDLDYPAEYQTQMGGQLFSFPTRCPECGEEREAEIRRMEQERQAAMRDRERRERLRVSGIPDRYAGKRLDDFKCEPGSKQERAVKIVRQYADNWPTALAHGVGLIMIGNPGTGKTHLACALARLVAETDPVRYVTAAGLIKRIRHAWRDQELNEDAVAREFTGPALLILDEVGVQYATESERIILFDVLDSRYGALKPTIAIGNVTETELRANLGARVVDRLTEGGGALLEFDWESYRGRV